LSDGAGELPRIVIVAGPTASGKTELAAAIARSVGGEIVGADSRQVYRYLDVATAKPPLELRREIPHHLIDVVDPDQPYDASDWLRDAIAKVRSIHGSGRQVIVCGGTGLYIRSLLRGLFQGPAAAPDVRRRLSEQESAEPGSLHARLQDCDGITAARVHPNDLVRVIRALEVFELTGRPLSRWHEDHRLAVRLFDSLVMEVRIDKIELDRRIEERSRAMVENGLLDELRALRGRGYGPELKPFDAIGYREAGACLDGRLEPAQLAPEIASATRRYAKRQRVWLRGQESTEPVDPARPAQAVARARAFLDRVATRGSIG
jgi:tRNA dimethylallyltransferase